MSRVPCGEPVAFPIRSHRVPGLTSSKRGIALQFGTPAQTMVLGYNPFYSAVTVSKAPVDDQVCPSDFTQKRCIYFKGGLFEPNNSRSFKGNSKPSEGTDIFRFNDGGEVKDFPLILESRTSGSWHTHPFIGLKPSSDIVNRLMDNKKIPSRVFSFDFGRTGRTESDGELLYGGYNKKRVKGGFDDMHEFSVAPSSEICPYQVTFRKITMIDENGDRTVMLGKASADSMRACLNPSHPTINMPTSVFQVLNDKMGGLYDINNNKNRDFTELHLWGYAVEKEKNFKGSLEFETTSGLVVTVPNEQLVTNTRHVNDDGNIVMEPKKSTLLLNNLAGDNTGDLPHMGAPFMSSIYLAVDGSRKKFWLGNTAYAAPNDNDYALLPGSEVSDCTPPASEQPADNNNGGDNSNGGGNNNGGGGGNYQNDDNDDSSSEPNRPSPPTTRKNDSPRPTDDGENSDKPSPTRRPANPDSTPGSDESEADEPKETSSRGAKPTKGSGGGWGFGDEKDVNWSDPDKIVPGSNDDPDRGKSIPDVDNPQRGVPQNQDRVEGSGPNGEKDGPPMAMIGGAVGGGVFLLLLIAGVILFIKRRKRRTIGGGVIAADREGKCSGDCLLGPNGEHGPGCEQSRFAYVPASANSSPQQQHASIVYEVAPPDPRYEMASASANGGFSRDGRSVYEVPTWSPATELDSRQSYGATSPGSSRGSPMTNLHYSNSHHTTRITPRGRTSDLPPLPNTHDSAPPEYHSLMVEMDANQSPAFRPRCADGTDSYLNTSTGTETTATSITDTASTRPSASMMTMDMLPEGNGTMVSTLGPAGGYTTTNSYANGYTNGYTNGSTGEYIIVAIENSDIPPARR